MSSAHKTNPKPIAAFVGIRLGGSKPRYSHYETFPASRSWSVAVLRADHKLRSFSYGHQRRSEQKTSSETSQSCIRCRCHAMGIAVFV